MTEIFLNIPIQEPTGIREYLVHKMYDEMGMDTLKCALGHIKIDGKDCGLVTIVEAVNEEYVVEKYNTESGNLYKVERFEGKIEFSGADLYYRGQEEENYDAIFRKIQTEDTNDEDKKKLIEIIKKINESDSPEVIEECFIDFDKIIKMIAINRVTGNNDSFDNGYLRNYYIYEKDGKIDIIPYDFNISFGVLADGIEIEAADTELKQTASINTRIVEIILQNEQYLNKYNQYVEEALNRLEEWHAEGVVNKIDNNVHSLVENKETTTISYENYKNGIKGIKEFIEKRVQDEN